MYQNQDLVNVFMSCAHRYANKKVTFLDTKQGQHIHINYDALFKNALAVLKNLPKFLQPRETVIICIDDPQDFINYFWACILGGYIPLSTLAQKHHDNFDINEQLFKLWEVLNKPKIITTAKLSEYLQRRFNQESSQKPTFIITEKPVLNSAQFEPNLQQVVYPLPDDIAFLVTSSGSTGLSKIAMVKHMQITAALANKQQIYTDNSQNSFFSWMPLTHVTGLIECHIFSIYNGMDQIHLKMMEVIHNPIILLRYFSELRSNFTFMPNFAFDMLSSAYKNAATEKLDLSHLKYINTAGTLVVYHCAQRFMRTLRPTGIPENVLVPSWGMAETCACSVYNMKFSISEETDPTFVSLGPPLPGIHLRVVDTLGQPVEKEVVGKLEVSGPMVTSGFFNNPTQTAAYFTSDGWYKTGDLAYLKNGELYLVSREGGSIVYQGKTIYHHEIEYVVNTVLKIVPMYTAAITVSELAKLGGETQQSVVILASIENHDDESTMAAAIRQIYIAVQAKIGIVPRAILILPSKEINITPELYKIKKNALIQNYAEGRYKKQEEFYHQVMKTDVKD